MSASGLSTPAAVEKAIKLAQDAVRADEVGGIEEAIALYQESVALIKHGLQVQSEEEVVDTTTLHKYAKLYSDRIAELQRSLAASEETLGGASEPSGASGGQQQRRDNANLFSPASSAAGTPNSAALGGAPSATSLLQAFAFDEPDMADCTPPPPAPAGHDEWRRPFWLMRILRQSMVHGGYLTPDGRVFVPRRLWVQKGARFGAMAAKVECAQCLHAELTRIGGACDPTQPDVLLRELERLGSVMDDVQNSLHRVLQFIPEPRVTGAAAAAAAAAGERDGGSAMSKLTERFKGLAKTLDKTAARLGAMPTKVSDPSEYVHTLVTLFDSAEVIQEWAEAHQHKGGASTPLHERLARCTSFLYEVVCAFVIQDLDGLLQRHMRKATVGFVKGGLTSAE